MKVHARLAALTVSVALSHALVAQPIAINVGTQRTLAVAPGATMTVPVTVVPGAAGVALTSITVTLAWNPARLALQSLTPVTSGQGTDWVITANTSASGAGQATLTAFGPAMIPPSMVLANAVFVAAASGGTSVSASVTTAVTSGAREIASAIQPRALDVCIGNATARWGDVNDDQTVNVIDAQQIARYSVGLSVTNTAAIFARGDVNQDAAVSIVDGQQIARHSVGLWTSSRTNVVFVPAPAPTSITLSAGSSLALTAGSSSQIVATPDVSGASVAGCATPRWTSTNSAVASVNASGFVAAIGPGTATIIADAAGGSASASLVLSVSPSSFNPGAGVPEAGTFVKSTVTVGSTAYPYQIFIPLSYTTGVSTPLIVAMAGSEEQGMDGNKQVNVGFGPVVQAQAATFPAFVLFPQFPVGPDEDPVSHGLHRQIAIAAINKIRTTYNIDAARIYLTGLSYGSGMSFELAHFYPSTFAAAVTIANFVCDACIIGSNATPGSSYAGLAQNVHAMAFWMFHGSTDPNTLTSVTLARQLRTSLAAGGADVRYTEYGGLGHEIWDLAYSTPSLLGWMFSRHR